MNYKEDFVDINGVKIHYLTIGKGKPVVFVHGWPLAFTPNHYLHEKLSKNFQLYFFDLPYYGKSGKLKGKHNFGDYSKVLDSFIKEMKIKKPVLISFSAGGVITFKYVIEHQNEISSLVICASSNSNKHFNFKLKIYAKLFLWSYDNLFFVRSIVKNILQDENKIKKFWKTIEPSANMDQKITKDTLNAIKKIDIDVSRDLLEYMLKMDFTEDCKKIKTPTFLASGGKDNLMPPKCLSEAHDLIENSEFIIVPGADHSNVVNKEVSDRIHDFIKNKCF